MGRPRTIALNYFFSREDLDNRIFDPARQDPKARFMQSFRALIRERGGEVVTLDTVDCRDPAVTHALYFDTSWRYALSDPFLRTVPHEKRALIIIEPANVNPSLYYTSLLRDRFATVFTWDLDLLRRNPDYVRIHVPAGVDLLQYRENRFAAVAYADKKLLVAVNANRWSYMPQSNYRLRMRAFRYFERAFPEQFDLYGIGWNAPRIFYERWLGHPFFASYRGPIADKIQVISGYRFALCFENNAFQAGYVSEKITDFFCARCVPVYYGWKGAGTRIPDAAKIDLRAFRSFAELGRYLRGMSEAEHRRYVEAIDRFMRDDRLQFFTTRHMLDVVSTRLGFPAGVARPTDETGRPMHGTRDLDPRIIRRPSSCSTP